MEFNSGFKGLNISYRVQGERVGCGREYVDLRERYQETGDNFVFRSFVLYHSQIIVKCNMDLALKRTGTCALRFGPQNLTAQLCILCEFSGSHSGAVPLMTGRFEGTYRRHPDLEPLTAGVSFR